MQVLYERCAGIDVHKKTVVVTVLQTHCDGTAMALRWHDHQGHSHLFDYDSGLARVGDMARPGTG